MPFLSFLLKVAPLQNDMAQLERDSFCVPLYQTVSRILAWDGEAGAASSRLSHTKTHVTVTLVGGGRDQRSIRVTVCGQGALVAVEMLLSALTEQPVWRCGRQCYRVLSVDLAGPPLASACTWSDLLAPSSSSSELRLRFVTPAVFAGVVGDSVSAEAFPQPLQVFSSLLSRWSQLEGPPLACEVLPWLQRYECVVSDYWLKARPIGLITGAGAVLVYPGWTGRITYACREPLAPYMSVLRALAQLACFTGVGEYTEVGLGVTQVVENE